MHICSAGLVWRAGLGFVLLGTAWQQRAHVRFSMDAPVQGGQVGVRAVLAGRAPGGPWPALRYFPSQTAAMTGTAALGLLLCLDHLLDRLRGASRHLANQPNAVGGTVLCLAFVGSGAAGDARGALYVHMWAR